jgi:hypothetical protein
VGASNIDTVMTLATSEVSSVCANGFQRVSALPYNFADLVAPVPASAWGCQPWCDDLGFGFQDPFTSGVSHVDVDGRTYTIRPTFNNKGMCSPWLIVDEVFRPVLAVPLQLRGLDPAWATCGLDLLGIYDPPIALTAEATAAAATLAPFLQTSTAVPGGGIAADLTPAKATQTAPAPTATATSTQQAQHFTYSPQADSLPATTTLGDADAPQAVAKAPITISAVVITQSTGAAVPTVAGAPAAASPTLNSPPVVANPDPVASPPAVVNSNPVVSTNGPPNGSGSGQPPSSMTAFAIGSQTVSAGGPAVTASGTTFSALPSGSGVQIIVGGLTSTLIIPAPGASTTSSGKANVVVGSQTLTVGGPAITQAGTTYSALPSGSGIRVVANGQTSTVGPIAFAAATPSTGSANSSPAIKGPSSPANVDHTTTAGPSFKPVGPASQSAWVIGGDHTITHGQAYTANGTIFTDVSGTLYTGAAPSSTIASLAPAVKQGAAAGLRIGDLSWKSSIAVGFSVCCGILAVVL